MTITGPDARSAAPGQAVVNAAMLVLERMGLTPADLLAAPAATPPAPTFAEYIPVVSALVSDGCRRAPPGPSRSARSAFPVTVRRAPALIPPRASPAGNDLVGGRARECQQSRRVLRLFAGLHV